MKKKRNLIGVCLVAVLMLALTVIGYAAGDGEAAPEYGAWCLVPPLVTIVLAFVTKQTIISMFIGIWVGATIIHHFNPIDGLIGSFTGYLVPSIADSWNAGMLIIMALIGALDALVTLSGLLYVLLYLFGLAFAFYPLTRWCKENEGFSWPWPRVESEKKRIKKLRRQQEAEKAEREEK